MPFDGLLDFVVSDLVKLRVALDGVRSGWSDHRIGDKDEESHCLIGWLLIATDWHRDEAVRLCLDYVYPALPPLHQKPERLKSIYNYNDSGSQKRVEKLLAEACRLAEQPTVR